MNKEQLERAGIRAMLISIGVFFACSFVAILSGMNGWQVGLVALTFIIGAVCAAWVSVIALCELDYDKRHPHDSGRHDEGAA